MELLRNHYDCLRDAYVEAGGDGHLILTAMFAMVMRYESLSMYKVRALATCDARECVMYWYSPMGL